MKIFTVAVALMLVVGLSACGGGSGGSPRMMPQESDQPPQMTEETEEETMEEEEPDPQPPPPSIADTFNALINASTLVTEGESAGKLTYTLTVQPTPDSLNISHLHARLAREEDKTFQPLEARQGVPLAFNHIQLTSEINPISYFSYGGWLDHSFFLVAVYNQIINENPLDVREEVFADMYSIGNATGTNPVSGSATWRGAVAGVDQSETDTEGNVILGNATLTIDDFVTPSIDVVFANLRDQTTNGRRADMSWSNLALTNGAFHHNGNPDARISFDIPNRTVNTLTGRFYGPNHEEVGGVFSRDEIAGSFGATRQ